MFASTPYSSTRSLYPSLAVLTLALPLGLTPPSVAHAACGGGPQRMEVAVLPDIFIHSGATLNGLPYHYTANLDLPVRGDCNVMGRATIEDVGINDSYCSLTATCGDTHWSPEAATVGAAISDLGVAESSLSITARPGLRPGQIGAIELFTVDCATDICVPPPCLREDPHDEDSGSEFYEGDRGFVPYDPEDDCWQSDGPGVGSAYLIGRGNLYTGAKHEPAFRVTAHTTTDALTIQHTIANDNPNAVVLITPLAEGVGDARNFGVHYDLAARRWQIVNERQGAQIPSGATFSVYVMGNLGPGTHLRAGNSGAVSIDDPLANDNPNAVILATHQITDLCTESDNGRETGPNDPSDLLDPSDNPEPEWDCGTDHFDHPLAVEYDGTRWWVVSADGTAIPQGARLHVFIAGLPGTYRSDEWHPERIPQYAGRLESVVGTPSGSLADLGPVFHVPDPDQPVLAIHNLYPAGGAWVEPLTASIGLEFVGLSWHARTLDDRTMVAAGFNAFAPLPAVSPLAHDVPGLPPLPEWLKLDLPPKLFRADLDPWVVVEVDLDDEGVNDLILELQGVPATWVEEGPRGLEFGFDRAKLLDQLPDGDSEVQLNGYLPNGSLLTATDSVEVR